MFDAAGHSDGTGCYHARQSARRQPHKARIIAPKKANFLPQFAAQRWFGSMRSGLRLATRQYLFGDARKHGQSTLGFLYRRRIKCAERRAYLLLCHRRNFATTA